jgi:hypothetical protein
MSESTSGETEETDRRYLAEIKPWLEEKARQLAFELEAKAGDLGVSKEEVFRRALDDFVATAIHEIELESGHS